VIVVANFASIYTKPARALDNLGRQMLFYIRVVKSIPRTVKNYKKEVVRLLAEVTLGSGSLAVIGGTIGVIAAMCFFTGTSVGIQGYAALDQLGTAALTGFISAYFNTREIAPLVAGIALAATVGCGFTAQLGAMRISEEIDALEVMGIKSISYLVSTRIMAGFVVIIPLYAMAIIMSFLSAQITTTLFYGQSTGTYEHYFRTFLRPDDVAWSFVQAIIISVIVMLNHCYYGFYASGGPVGVGEAVGRSMRASLIAIVLVVLFASLALYGTDANFNLTV
jgi:phospholipid/cholesterol/gamma-HCH transport system permease protein